MMTRSPVDNAAMNLRLATMQMTGMRVPPRVRTIPHIRRRLSVTIISSPAETVIIRQAAPNLDTSFQSRPVQDQRV
jgi:hypothetical protein